MAQSVDDPGAAERMERARREASSPLRMIIEASQVKKGTATGVPTPVPADAAASARAGAVTVRAVHHGATVHASGSAAERAPRHSQGTVVRSAAVPAPTAQAVAPSEPPLASTERPLAAKAGESASTPPVEDLNQPATAVGRSPQGSDDSAPTASVQDPAAARSELQSAAPKPLVAVVPPKLVHYVEPELTQQLRGRVKPEDEVVVGFKVNVDGSVSDVEIRATSNKVLDQIVMSAVRQWRYAPLTEPRVHAALLVFKLE